MTIVFTDIVDSTVLNNRLRSAHIWRGQDDPNVVVLAETYDSREAAEADATNPAMLEAMERDGVDLASVTLDYLEEHVSPVMEEAGYSTERDASELRSSGTHIRIWSILLIILFFPISLLLLLAVKLASGNDGALLSRRDSLTIKVSPLGSGSRVTVIGRVGQGARDQLTQLLAGIGEQRTPAGWYEEAAGIERYWDGEKWAQQTRRTTDLPIVVGPRMQHAQTKARQANQ